MAVIQHVTLLTGQTRASPRREVSPETIDALRPLIVAGGGPLPGPPGYSIMITRTEVGAVYTISGAAGPLVTCCLAEREDQAADVWQLAAELHERLYGAPARVARRPDRAPWLAIVILPTIATDRSAAEWLGDAERCIAWALLEWRRA